MRILTLAHNFPPSLGGIQLRAYNIARRLVDRGHHVTVATSFYKGAGAFETIGGISVRRFARRVKWLGHPWYIMPGMLGMVKERNGSSYNVVHAYNFESFPSLIGTLFRLIRRKPFVLSAAYHPWQDIYSRTIGPVIMDMADTVVVQCEEERRYVTSLVPSSKVRLIPGGVDTEIFRELPEPDAFKRSYGLCSDEKLILYAGSFSGHKRVHELVKMMPSVLKAVGKVRLVLIGDGSRREVVSEVQRLGIGKWVTMLDRFSPEELVTAYAGVDVFCTASSSESFGQVIVQAAAAGVPIIACRIGVAPEIVVDGVNGRLVDVERFADSLIEILTVEKFKRNAMKMRNRILNGYSWDKVAADTERLYQSLL